MFELAGVIGLAGSRASPARSGARSPASFHTVFVRPIV